MVAAVNAVAADGSSAVDNAIAPEGAVASDGPGPRRAARPNRLRLLRASNTPPRAIVMVRKQMGRACLPAWCARPLARWAHLPARRVHLPARRARSSGGPGPSLGSRLSAAPTTPALGCEAAPGSPDASAALFARRFPCFARSSSPPRWEKASTVRAARRSRSASWCSSSTPSRRTWAQSSCSRDGGRPARGAASPTSWSTSTRAPTRCIRWRSRSATSRASRSWRAIGAAWASAAR